MFHLKKLYKEAIDCFLKVEEHYKDDKQLYIRRGKVYQDMGNHQFAIEDFSTA